MVILEPRPDVSCLLFSLQERILAHNTCFAYAFWGLPGTACCSLHNFSSPGKSAFPLREGFDGLSWTKPPDFECDYRGGLRLCGGHLHLDQACAPNAAPLTTDAPLLFSRRAILTASACAYLIRFSSSWKRFTLPYSADKIDQIISRTTLGTTAFPSPRNLATRPGTP